MSLSFRCLMCTLEMTKTTDFRNVSVLFKWDDI